MAPPFERSDAVVTSSVDFGENLGLTKRVVIEMWVPPVCGIFMETPFGRLDAVGGCTQDIEVGASRVMHIKPNFP